jgi:hypothetical protein
MARQLLCRGFISTLLMLGTTGCETTRSFLHRDKDDDVVAKKDRDTNDPASPRSVSSDSNKIDSVDSTDKERKPFFKSDRRPGGLSSESREIERDLGIN